MSAMPSSCVAIVCKHVTSAVTKKALDGRGGSCSITLGKCFVPLICDKRWRRVLVLRT